VQEFSLLFHVHTKASHDSNLDIRSIIKHCVQHKVDILTVTDHDSFERMDEYSRLCSDAGIRLIRGVEYSSDAGDVIGLFLNEFQPKRDCNSILQDIRRQGGISVLPHPFHGHDLDMIDFDLLDGIEVFNARCTNSLNEKAAALAQDKGKAQFAAGDVHLRSELGLVRTILKYGGDGNIMDDDLKHALLSARRRFLMQYTPRPNIYLSQAIKGIKTRRPGLLVRNVAKFLLRRNRQVGVNGNPESPDEPVGA